MKCEPKMIVYCDNCGEEIELGLTTTGRGYDERSIDSDLKREGWILDGESTFCCEVCKDMYNEKVEDING